MSSAVILSNRFDQRGRSRQLVVIMHGWAGNARRMAQIRGSVEARLPDADIFLPEYHATVFSNTDPDRVAQAFEDEMRALVQRRAARTDAESPRYEQIVMIGYSIGALIVRQMYLHGRGLTDQVSRQEILENRLIRQDWTKIPIRMILLAGMNRGWSLSPGRSRCGPPSFSSSGSGCSSPGSAGRDG